MVEKNKPKEKWQRFNASALAKLGHFLHDKGLVETPYLSRRDACKAIGFPAGRGGSKSTKVKCWKEIRRYIQDEIVGKSDEPQSDKPLPKPKKVYRQSKAERQAFYESDAWRMLRYKALKMHGARCQCCGATPASSGGPLHVDHIKPRSKFPELELVLDNLQILCKDCNLGKSARDQTDWRPQPV